jgi:hypothetical protein
MKLSHVTLSLLILGASAGMAQEGRKRQATDKTKPDKNRHATTTKHKVKPDSTKTTPKPDKISKDYCPPCGMG